MYLCTYFVPKLPYGGNVLIITLLKISKVSKSKLYYVLISFVKCRLVVMVAMVAWFRQGSTVFENQLRIELKIK